MRKINYQKLDFLLEINATETINKILSQEGGWVTFHDEDRQRPIFTMKNAAKFLKLFLKKYQLSNTFNHELIKLHDDELTGIYIKTHSLSVAASCELIKQGNTELISFYISKYHLTDEAQVAIIQTGNLMLIKQCIQKDHFGPSAEAALISLKNLTLIELYISRKYKLYERAQKKLIKLHNEALTEAYFQNYPFSIDAATEFMRTHSTELVKAYILKYGYTFHEQSAKLEDALFELNNKELILCYAKEYAFWSKKQVYQFLRLGDVEMITEYLKKNTPMLDEASALLLTEMEDKTPLELYISIGKLPEEAELQLFELPEAPKWIARYMARNYFSEQAELKLFEPLYSDLLRPYMEKHSLVSYKNEQYLLNTGNANLIRFYISKHSLNDRVVPMLFDLDDNYETLRHYIRTHKSLLCEAAEEKLFALDDDDLKLFYVIQIGEDK